MEHFYPATTPRVRFREEVPVLSATTSSSVGSCLAMPSMSGYKNRVPIVTYMLIEDDTDQLPTMHVQVGLSDVTYDQDELLRWTSLIYRRPFFPCQNKGRHRFILVKR